IFVGNNNRLFVTDTNNNRLLIYNVTPSTNNTSADVVIGQADFTHGSANQGGSVAANTLNSPREITIFNNQLFIADAIPNRILIFPNTTGTGGSVSTPLLSI